jgi:hypothetical protein
MEVLPSRGGKRKHQSLVTGAFVNANLTTGPLRCLCLHPITTLMRTMRASLDRVHREVYAFRLSSWLNWP